MEGIEEDLSSAYLTGAVAQSAFCHLPDTCFTPLGADGSIILGKDKMADARNSPQWPILVGEGACQRKMGWLDVLFKVVCFYIVYL